MKIFSKIVITLALILSFQNNNQVKASEPFLTDANYFYSYLHSQPFLLLSSNDTDNSDKKNSFISPLKTLGRAFVRTKDMLIALMELLLALLVLLSIILFLSERIAQPNIYRNYFTSLKWSFVKSIADPGEMAPPKPVSLVGKIVANIIGFMGVAIFAIPAGIIGAGFISEFDDQKHEQQVKDNIERVIHGLRWEKEKDMNLFYVPAYKPVNTLVTKQYLSQDAIIEAVKESPNLHLYNLAKAFNTEDLPVDEIVVVGCPHNRPYGYFVDRGSKITIVSTSGPDEPITSWVAYHVAKFGGFNYVAKEVELDPDNPVSFYNIDESEIDKNRDLFLKDISNLSSRDSSWVLPFAFCIGPKSRLEKLHICYSPIRGDGTYDNPDIAFKDIESFDKFYNELESTMKNLYGLITDKNKHYAYTPSNNVIKKTGSPNGFAIRFESHFINFSSDKLKVIKDLAEIIARNLEPGVKKEIPKEMLTRPENGFGYRGYVE